MKYKPVRDRCCQNEKCQDHSKFGEGNIIRHSKYKTRQGRRRRYLCKTCKKTFCSTKGTPYYRLHKPRSVFDEVVQMTVEGVGISSISRIKCFSWNTIARWQYLACQTAGEFNNQIWGAGRPVIPGIRICLMTTLLSKCVIIILFGRIQP